MWRFFERLAHDKAFMFADNSEINLCSDIEAKIISEIINLAKIWYFELSLDKRFDLISH